MATRTLSKVIKERARRRRERIRSRRRRRRRRVRPATKAETASRLRSMTRPRYSVVCFYRGGLDGALDRKLRKVARQDGDSGMFLWTGIRDLEFYYPTLAKAKVAARRFKATEFPKVVIIMIRSFQLA